MATAAPFPTAYATAGSLLLHVVFAWVAAAAPEPSTVMLAATPRRIDVELDGFLPSEEPSAPRSPVALASPLRESRSNAQRAVATSLRAPSAHSADHDAANATTSLVPAADPQLPVAHFLLGSASARLAPSSGSRLGSTESAAPEVLPEQQVSVRARLSSGGGAAYPPEARAAEVEADVQLEIVVNASGRVIAARPTSNAGYGLEQAAVSAVRGYRFSPASQSGRAVAVRMRWTVQFRLH